MIKFKYFDPRKNIGYQLGSALRDIRCKMDKRQEKFGFTRYEWLVVGILLKADSGCLSQYELRTYIGIEDSYLTKVLDKLIDKKIIKKVICNKDRRHRILTIDRAAEPLIGKVVKEIMEGNESYLDGFSEAERNQLFGFLDRVRENATK